MASEDVTTYDLLRKVKSQLDALEKLLADTWLQHAKRGTQPPSRALVDEVNLTRHEYERLVALVVATSH